MCKVIHRLFFILCVMMCADFSMCAASKKINLNMRPNSRYQISSVVDLRGKTIRVSKESVIVFGEKGQLKNGTIIGDVTSLEGLDHVCFKNIRLEGTFYGDISDGVFMGPDNIVWANLLRFDSANITRDFQLDDAIPDNTFIGDLKIYSNNITSPTITIKKQQAVVLSRKGSSGNLSVENISIVDDSESSKSRVTSIGSNYKRYGIIGLNGNRIVHLRKVRIDSGCAICVSGNYYGTDVLDSLVIEDCSIHSADFPLELARWDESSIHSVFITNSSLGGYYVSDGIKSRQTGPISIVSKKESSDSQLVLSLCNTVLSDGYCEIVNSSSITFDHCTFYHAQPVYSSSTIKIPNKKVFVEGCTFYLYNDISTPTQNLVGGAESITFTNNSFKSRVAKSGTNMAMEFYNCKSVSFQGNCFDVQDGGRDAYIRFDKSVQNLKISDNKYNEASNQKNNQMRFWVSSDIKMTTKSNKIAVERKF